MDLDNPVGYPSGGGDMDKSAPDHRRSTEHLPPRSISPGDYHHRMPSSGGSRGGSHHSYPPAPYEYRGRGSSSGPPRGRGGYEPRGGYRGGSSDRGGGGYRGRGSYDRGKTIKIVFAILKLCALIRRKEGLFIQLYYHKKS